MSSNCPPQLQLSIQPSTTTFKRSFEQFGFDLDSPVGSTDAGGSGTDNGNDRNKRARSSSSFSESSDSTEASRNTSSTLASGSESNSSISRDEPSTVAAVLATVRPSTDPPPRLPTPIIQDIDMAEVLPENDPETAGPPQQTPQQTEDRYRLSLERFNAFENNISLLRRSQSLSPAMTRSPTPPPMLPPLSIVSSSNQHLHQHQNPQHRPRAAHLSPTDIAFFRHPPPRSSSPFLNHFLNTVESPLSEGLTGGEETSVRDEPEFLSAQSRFRGQFPASHQHRPQTDTADEEIEMVNGFRDRLNTALERLRPASPLVPGLGNEEETAGQDQDEDETQEEDETDEDQEEEDDDDEEATSTNDPPHSLPPDPPTLPPIPPITADTDADDYGADWNVQPDIRSQNDLEQRFIREMRERAQVRQDHMRHIQSLQSSSSRNSEGTSLFWPPSTAANPSLRDHPLPSPILRDLHSWMQERGSLGETSAGDATDTPISGHMYSSASTSTSNNSHVDQRQQSQVSNTQSVSTGPQQSNTISGGVSRVNEWDNYDRFPPQSTPAPGSSGLASASSAASTSEGAQAPAGGNSFSSMGSSSSSNLFSNSTSLSYTRNLADEAAVRSLDHGIGVGLGFGPGAARPMPPLIRSGRSPTPRRNDATDEQPRHTEGPTLTLTPSGLGSTSNAGQSHSHRPITRFPSDNWLSFSRGSGIGQLPDLDLDFASMAGTAGSAMSSPSTSDDWRSEPFPAAPPGDRSLVRDSSPTTTSSIDEASFLNPTMSSLDFFSPTAPAHLPANIRHSWDEQPSTHQRPAVFRPSIRRCPHNPQCVYVPNQHSQASAGASTSSNPHIATTSDAERPQSEIRRGFGVNSIARARAAHEVQYRFLMDSEFGADSDALPLPNRIPSSSSPLLNRLNGSDTGGSHFLSNRLASSDAGQGQHSPFHRQRLRSSHSHARLGSSTSLVSENASEMRRMEDRAEVARSRAIHTLSNSRATQGSEDRTNTDDTSTDASNDERDRDLRRALAWDEIRARQRQQQLRHVGGAQASDPEANTTATRSSFDRLVQNAWQSLEQRDASVSSPEDEVPTWRARNLSTPASTAVVVGGASEDVDMTFVERQETEDMYWTTIFRELGFESDAGLFDTRNTRPSASQTRRDGWESDYNPYSLSWSDTIPSLANESRASGASTSTSPTGEGLSLTQRFPSFSSLVERSSSLNPTSESMDTTVDRTIRRFPLTYSRVPSLPSPDLGGTFNAERPTQPTSPTSALRPEEPSRHFSGLSTRQPSFSTLGSYGINPSHYQTPTTSTNTNSNPTRFNDRPRQQPRSITPEFGSRHRHPLAPWETMMDTSDDSPETSLFATLLESQERLAQLTARTQALANMRRSNNLAEFAPGPFRNTLQHRIDQHNAHRRRAGLPPNPPSIPPLSFGDSNLTSLSNSVPGSEPRAPEEADQHPINAPFQTTREVPPRPWGEPIRPVRPGAPASLNNFPQSRTQPRSFASARAAAMNEANRARGQGETYSSFMNRQMRIEASRLNDSASQRTSAAPNGNLSLEEIDSMARQRQILELSLRNRNRSRYNVGADNPVPPNRPVYPGSMDDDDSLRERLSNMAAGRGRRNRLHSPHEMMFFARGGRRGRPLGDFMRDEDFDESYESLLSLAQTLGDVKPRSTPAEIIEKMEKAQYKDWATTDSDQRCPICLDDYGQTDTVLKLTNCSHWLHQDCLHQWLQTANTCPVCRKSVSTNTGFRRGHHHHHRPFGVASSFRRDPPPGPGPSQGGSGSNAGNNPPSSNQGHHHHGFPPAPWRRGPPPV